MLQFELFSLDGDLLSLFDELWHPGLHHFIWLFLPFRIGGREQDPLNFVVFWSILDVLAICYYFQRCKIFIIQEEAVSFVNDEALYFWEIHWSSSTDEGLDLTMCRHNDLAWVCVEHKITQSYPGASNHLFIHAMNLVAQFSRIHDHKHLRFMIISIDP